MPDKKTDDKDNKIKTGNAAQDEGQQEETGKPPRREFDLGETDQRPFQYLERLYAGRDRKSDFHGPGTQTLASQTLIHVSTHQWEFTYFYPRPRGYTGPTGSGFFPSRPALAPDSLHLSKDELQGYFIINNKQFNINASPFDRQDETIISDSEELGKYSSVLEKRVDATIGKSLVLERFYYSSVTLIDGLCDKFLVDNVAYLALERRKDHAQLNVYVIAVGESPRRMAYQISKPEVVLGTGIIARDRNFQLAIKEIKPYLR